MRHLYKVSGAVRTDICDARGAVLGLRGDLFQHRPKRVIRFFAAAWHDARSVECAFFAAGDAGADEVDALLAQLALSAARVCEVRVASVDDDVAGLQERRELRDHCVRGLSGLHHDDQTSWPFQSCHEFLGTLGRDEITLIAKLFDEFVGASGRAVVYSNGVSIACEIPGQVAPHDGKSCDTDLRCAAHCGSACFRFRGLRQFGRPP